jgi:hypothetical protein
MFQILIEMNSPVSPVKVPITKVPTYIASNTDAEEESGSTNNSEESDPGYNSEHDGNLDLNCPSPKAETHTQVEFERYLNDRAHVLSEGQENRPVIRKQFRVLDKDLDTWTERDINKINR